MWGRKTVGIPHMFRNSELWTAFKDKFYVLKNTTAVTWGQAIREIRRKRLLCDLSVRVKRWQVRSLQIWLFLHKIFYLLPHCFVVLLHRHWLGETHTQMLWYVYIVREDLSSWGQILYPPWHIITFVRATVKRLIDNLTWDRWGVRSEGGVVWKTNGLKCHSGPQKEAQSNVKSLLTSCLHFFS